MLHKWYVRKATVCIISCVTEGLFVEISLAVNMKDVVDFLFEALNC